MKKPIPKIGQWWHFKMPNAHALSFAKITDVTPLTIEFQGHWPATMATRYCRSDIKLIERDLAPDGEAK